MTTSPVSKIIDATRWWAVECGDNDNRKFFAVCNSMSEAMDHLNLAEQYMAVNPTVTEVKITKITNMAGDSKK